MEQRFIRNIPSISEAEQRALRTKRAVILGCGGLGGYNAEILARTGLGALTLVDGDCFEESNLNRQLLSLPSLIGSGKARAAGERIRAIDPAIELRCFDEFFTAENADEILADADIVLDSLDNIPSRLLLEDKCAEKGISIVHGAVGGWMAQVCVVRPGDGYLRRIYGSTRGENVNKSLLPAVAPLCASLQCAEAVKLLCGRTSGLEGKLLMADVRNMEFFTLEL